MTHPLLISRNFCGIVSSSYHLCASHLLVDEQTIEREYAPLECIADNYEKVVVSLDDLQLPSRKGITHVRAWELSQML